MVARKEPLEQVCPRCSRTFLARFGKTVFCSKGCRSSAYYHAKIAKPKIGRACEHCGASFMPGSSRARYCSKRCRSAAGKAEAASLREVKRFDETPGEAWLPVSGLPHYEVSDHGRVRNRATSKYLKLRTNRFGRHYVDLWSQGRGYKQQVHRLVLEHFIGPCPEGMQACHNDGDRLNNRVKNLRWDTASANQRDRERHGTANIGESNPRAKLSAADVAEIRALHAARSLSGNELAERFGVKRGTIYSITSGRAWKKI